MRRTRRHKAERNSVYFGIVRLKHSVFVRNILYSPERAPDDLLTEKLCRECTNAQNMRYRVDIPSFGEHGNRHDAFDILAKPARLADGVHHLAQKFLVGRFVSALKTGLVFLMKVLNLFLKNLLKIFA